jgi:predicted RNA-binding protein Jag
MTTNESENANSDVDKAITFLRGVFARIPLEVEVNGTADHRVLRVSVTGKDAETLITGRGAGARSDLLDALGLLVSRHVYSGEPAKTAVIDANGFRDARLEQLSDAADRLAEAAKRTGTLRVYGMNSFDRRAVHLRLAETSQLTTDSEGDGSLRALVVSVAQPEGEG